MILIISLKFIENYHEVQVLVVISFLLPQNPQVDGVNFKNALIEGNKFRPLIIEVITFILNGSYLN